jgi:hypothetical protein
MVRLRSASAPSPSGHARTRSTIARTSAGITVIGVLPVPLVARLSLNSVPSSSHCGAVCETGVTGSSRSSRSLAGHVAASVGDGIDQPFVAQHTYRAPRRGPGDLELFNQFAFGGYPRIRLVLARGDAPTKDVRDLPVRRNRGDRVNTVSAPICHIDNFSYRRPTSYVSLRVESASYVCRQADTSSYSL